MSLSDDDFAYFVECIEHADPAERAFALKRRRDVPSGDPRVLAYLERLLSDQAVCLVMLPPMYGELRDLAAQALAAERRKQGDATRVKLANVPYPLSTDQIVELERKHGLEGRAGAEHLPARYQALRDRGLVPARDLDL